MLDRLNQGNAARNEERETRRLLRRMERADLRLLAFPLLVIVLLSAGLIMSDQRIWNTSLSFREGPSDELAFLTLNLVLYIVFRHRRVRLVYTRLLDERVRAESLARRIDELWSILEVSSRVRSTEEIDPTMRSIAEKARECLRGDVATVFLKSADGRRLEAGIRVVPGEPDPAHPAEPLPARAGVAGTVAETGRPLILSDAREIAQRSDEREGLDRMESVLSVPLLRGNEILGAVTVARSEGAGERFALSDLQILMIFADYAAYVVRSASLQEQIRTHTRELEALSDALARARRFLDLTEAPPTRERILSRLGHDLANPLTSILGYSQLLQSIPLESKPKQYVDHIFGETRRCQEIVDGIISLLQEGDADRLSCDLNRIVESALGARTAAHAERGITVIRDLAADLPPLLGNSVLLHEAVSQLVANAEEALSAVDGERILRISTSRHEGRARLAVEDNGSGVPEELRERVFEPFFSTRSKGSSTGLGLTVAAKIVRDHGGDIRCEASEPGGARFVLEIPLNEGSPSMPAGQPPGADEPRSVDGTSPGARSLDNGAPGLLQSNRHGGAPE
jgi:signal transduction histidine kinase